MPHQDLALTPYFADPPAPRIQRSKKPLLLDILAITLGATIAGADTWEQVERFGKAKHDWLKCFLELPNGIPSHDSFNHVFAAIAPRNEEREKLGRHIANVSLTTRPKQMTMN
jgi:hypothetical protein